MFYSPMSPIQWNYNGFIFKSLDTISLKDTLIKAYNLPGNRIQEFKKRSFELSKSVTPDVWGDTISSFVN